MHVHRRVLLSRALAAAAVAAASTTAFVGVAFADHHGPAAECRGYPDYPRVPNPYIKVVAEDNEFDTDCVAAPAERDFRIYLENRDAEAHNISIYSADPATDENAEQLYKGKSVKGPGQEEYAFNELPPGEYWFQDDKVPGMNGTLHVAAEKKVR